jgi:hypothetical protein
MAEKEWILGKDVHEQDNMFDGFTFDDVITAMVCNEPVLDTSALLKTVITIFEQRMDDYRELLKRNQKEIIKAAQSRRNS